MWTRTGFLWTILVIGFLSQRIHADADDQESATTRNPATTTAGSTAPTSSTLAIPNDNAKADPTTSSPAVITDKPTTDSTANRLATTPARSIVPTSSSPAIPSDSPKAELTSSSPIITTENTKAVLTTTNPVPTSTGSTAPTTTNPATTSAGPTEAKSSSPTPITHNSIVPKSSSPDAISPHSTDPKSSSPAPITPNSTDPKSSSPATITSNSTDPKSSSPAPISPKNVVLHTTTIHPTVSTPAGSVDPKLSSPDTSTRATNLHITTQRAEVRESTTQIKPQPFTKTISWEDMQDPNNDNKATVQMCRDLLQRLNTAGSCSVTGSETSDDHKFTSVTLSIPPSTAQQIYDNIKKVEPEPSAVPKTLIAILSSCGALVFILFSFALYCMCHHRSYRKNQQHLTEELQTVENGYHDNPTLEVMEVQPEMQEKKLQLNGEFNDSWIVPIDNLVKEDIPDEEDTHL